jgi:hypothetical protein
VGVEDKFNVNLNQSLWGLVVAHASLGVAEHWCLRYLFILSLIAASIMTASVFFTMIAYTWNYCRAKFSKT